MLKVMLLMDRFAEDAENIHRFIEMTTGISKQLGGWINSLKNSKIKGQKFFNDESKRDYERGKGRDEALAKLADSQKALEERILCDLERRNNLKAEDES